jgi:DNA-binding GntR family transcriptional regulator
MDQSERIPSSGLVALPTTRSSAIADELRRLIQNGELRPGERLRQVEIATRFGVSTTPVREAFTSLAREGLIRKDDMRGAVVFEPNLADLTENYEIRGALEPLATVLAIDRISDEELDELDALVRQMRVAKRPRYHTLNRELHAKIYAAAGRPRLISIIESLRDSSDAYFRMAAQAPYDRAYQTQVHAEHEEIVAALRKRNARAAKTAVAKHLEHNFEHLTRRVEKQRAAEASRSAAARSASAR